MSFVDRFHIESEDKKIYDKIKKEEDFFNDFSNKDIVLYAIAVAFENNQPEPINHRLGYFLRKDMNFEEEALFKALAYHHTHDLAIINNDKEVFDIAEQYANGGIKILYSMIKSSQYGTFVKKTEEELVELLNNITKNFEIEK